MPRFSGGESQIAGNRKYKDAIGVMVNMEVFNNLNIEMRVNVTDQTSDKESKQKCYCDWKQKDNIDAALVVRDFVA